MRREYIDTMPNLAATWLSRLGLPMQALQAVPSQCAVCGHWPSPRICMDCRKRWIPHVHRCSRCALPLPSQAMECGACLRHPPRLSRCIAVLDYGYPWQKLITRYKFEGDLGLTRSLAHLISTHEQALKCLQHSDALLSVPASAPRIRERGFDHMDLLIRSLMGQTGCNAPVLTGSIQRRHVDLPQHSANRQQRLRQLRGVFSLGTDAASQISGKRILLLDDVMTTGATLDVLAMCLLDAGAASVSALVLARAT